MGEMLPDVYPSTPRIGMADESSAVATHALRHDSSPFWTGTGGSAVGAALIGEFSPLDKRTRLAAICAPEANDDIKQGKADLGKLRSCIRSST